MHFRVVMYTMSIVIKGSPGLCPAGHIRIPGNRVSAPNKDTILIFFNPLLMLFYLASSRGSWPTVKNATCTQA